MQNGKLIDNDQIPLKNKNIEIVRKNDLLITKLIEIRNKLI